MKGSCEIILKDAATGKIQKRVKHHNMLTNALTNILQPPAKFIAGANLSHWYQKMLPIYSGALGGILLFDEPLTENADNIIPDFSHCIGHAGGLYAGDNTYRGTLNTTESGPVTNGYKSVWDFSTNQANGTISAVALTSRFGGECGLLNSITEPYTNLFDDLKSYVTYSYNDEDRLYPAGRDYKDSYSAIFQLYWYFAGEFSKGIFTFFDINGTSIYVANVPWSDTLSVTDILNYSYFKPAWKKYTATHDFEYWTFSPTNDKCVILGSNSSTSQTLYYAEITADGIGNERQFTLADDNYATYNFNVNAKFEFNGYIYGMAGEQSVNFTQMYRIKVSDGSCEIIDLPKETDKLYVIMKLDDKAILKLDDSIYAFDGTEFIQTNLTTEHTPSYRENNFIYSSNYLPKPYYYDICRREDCTSLIPVVFNPYLGTINNLSEPITKTATQTMKIIYTLTNE